MNANEFDTIIENVDISGEAPDTEPERQYFFLARAVRVMNEIMGRSGLRPTAVIKTFGCQMNARDSEKLTGILKCVGYKILPEEAPTAFLMPIS